MAPHDVDGRSPRAGRRASGSASPPPARRARAADFMGTRADGPSEPPRPPRQKDPQRSRSPHSPRSPPRRSRNERPSPHRSPRRSPEPPRRRDRSRDRRHDKAWDEREPRREPDDEDGSHRRHRHRRDRDGDGDGGGSDERDRRRRSREPRDRREPDDRHAHRRRRKHRSPSAPRSPSPPPIRARGPLPSQQEAFTGEMGGQDPGAELAPKQQPNFGTSGKLAAETNTVAGTKVVLKYHEPPEARTPAASADWRLFEFKNGADTGAPVPLSERSCWLVGRETAVADLPVLHPSCSAQHAVLQFRHVERRTELGDRIGKVRLYLLDLESANGTFLNGERVEERRYVEVRGGDVIKFGQSSREYVIMLA